MISGGNVSMIEAVLLRVSFPDLPTARTAARAAVEARLVACAHISGIESVYRWQDNVEHEPETVIFFKTVRPRIDALCVLIRERHPYELPAIEWHRIDADEETSAWLKETTDS